MLKHQRREHWAFRALLILSSSEALPVLIWLGLIPADPKNALLGPFSATRWTLLAAAMAASVVFAILSLHYQQEGRYDALRRAILRFPSTPVIVFNVLAAGVLAGLILLIAPPPSLIPQGSSIGQRLAPLLVWLTVMCAQWGGFALAVFRVELRGWFSTMGARLQSWIARPLTGTILLAASVLVAIPQVYYIYYNFGDESNTMTIGWLIARGLRLYGEVFSHHFPFSYLWVALVVKIFGASFVALRLSLILLRTLTFALAMKLSRYNVAIGLAALSWSLLGHFYLGNALFYHSFSGMFMAAAFFIGLAILEGRISGRWFELGATGILLGLAVLTDPLKALPAGVLILAVSLAGLAWPLRASPVKRSALRAGTIAALLVACLAIYAVWLLSTNGLLDFYQAVIDFNLRVYSKYSPRISAADISSSITGLLDLFNAQWRIHWSPYYQWGSYVRLDTWAFTSFFYRLAILLACSVLLAQRKLLSAAYLYLFAATTLVRGATLFHSAPFVLLSLCASSLCLSGDLNSDRRPPGTGESQEKPHFHVYSGVLIGAIAWLAIFPAFTWLNLRGAAFLIENREKLAYADKFAGIAADAAYLRKATCNQPAARILVYPYEPIQYFAAQILPASKYHFLLPWVAEIGEQQVISDLANEPALVLIARDEQIWDYPVRQYLAELLDTLEKNYTFLEKADRYEVYRSPLLDQLCLEGTGP